ncbi:MAG: alkaline phosphatase [Candidatus Korobacteraceae bacterium]
MTLIFGRNWNRVLLAGVAMAVCPVVQAQQIIYPAPPSSAQTWYQEGQQALKETKKQKAAPRRAKNIILFIGDGMGISTVTAARILEGQLQGRSGEENLLSFEHFPNVALARTFSVNQQTSDSAPTMTAMVTGVKTKDGILAIDQDVVRGDYRTVAGNELQTILEIAEKSGKATGVVSTARITHATPAACYAHSPNRDWESDRELSADARAAGFKDIARQLVEFPVGDGLEVALGGGREYFIPRTMPDPEDSGSFGRRLTGDLTQQWVNSRPGSAYVWNKAAFDAINPAVTKRLLGLFERSHMEYEYDRPGDAAGEPSLTEMTQKAIDILSKNRKGYFLHVESGRIDHAHHAGNAYRALTDAIEFSRAIQATLERVDLKDTLIIVSADHSHVFTIGGYPTRGNDILGRVISNDQASSPSMDFDNDSLGLPYTTLNYANGPGWIPNNPGRPDLTNINTGNPGYLQEATVPLGSETHSGEDVAIYAIGPGSDLFRGVKDQTYIFHVMQDVFDPNPVPPGFWDQSLSY